MNDFETLLGALRAAAVDFVIIGGVAATVHELEAIRAESGHVPNE
jgi:hypothetical protein